MHKKQTILPYDASRLLEFLLERINAKQDRQLAQRLGVSSSIIQGIRTQRIPLSGSLLTRMADCANCAVAELRFVLGDRRSRIRLSHSISAAPAAQYRVLVLPSEPGKVKPDVRCAHFCHGGTPDEKCDKGVEQETSSLLGAVTQP
ncbi:hypothetical protein [Noviherbaspirillum pedocola]|uniref:Uncharacterized protein n=1 Tax=Noviherbaspirillum pedocola TaxID=2801341 RepID=A0A934T100_9BURK|nr:hypothetical protein [Noviherbaspirillum pedocola]MBK4736574.1 hypothetical protein [Noviherbaspirillum pedocola]